MSDRKTTKRTKARIDEYYCHIYPRRIWVGKNCTLADIQKKFVRRDGKEIEDRWDPQNCPQTLYVEDRKTHNLGCLVTFPSIKTTVDEYVEWTAHEAEHVKFSIFSDTMLDSTWESQEADAYMVGFAARCIYQTMFCKK